MASYKTVARFVRFEVRDFGLMGFVKTSDHNSAEIPTAFPINHTTQKVVQLAVHRLASASKAAGLLQWTDTDELLNRDFIITYRDEDVIRWGYHIQSFAPMVERVETWRYRDRPSAWARLKAWFASLKPAPVEPEFDYDWEDFDED